MNQQQNTSTSSQASILRSADPNTTFGRFSPAEILQTFGAPAYLLSNSFKTQKCSRVGVLAREFRQSHGLEFSRCISATSGGRHDI